MPLDYDLKMLGDISAKRLNIDPDLLSAVIIIKQSVDISDKEDIHFKVTAGVNVRADEFQTIIQCHDKGIFLLQGIAL